jgi:hypothetical protein
LLAKVVDSLFRRLAVKVLVVGFRIVAGMVDDAIPMIRRRIERVELHWNSAGIDYIVVRPGRDHYCETCSDRCPNAIENRIARTLFHSKELVELVNFQSNLFIGLQRHDNKLATFRSIMHLPKVNVPDSDFLDVLYKSLHDKSSFALSNAVPESISRLMNKDG